MMLGKMYENVELTAPANLEDLWNYFVANYKQMQGEDLRAIAGMSVNGVYVGVENWQDYQLKDKDEVNLLSQMGGG